MTELKLGRYYRHRKDHRVPWRLVEIDTENGKTKLRASGLRTACPGINDLQTQNPDGPLNDREYREMGQKLGQADRWVPGKTGSHGPLG